MECEWRVCVSSTDALVGHSWAYGEIMRLADALVVLWSAYMKLDAVTALICANIDVSYSSRSFCDVSNN